MKLSLLALSFLLLSVIFISGCTTQRMEVGSVNKAFDEPRAMPVEQTTSTQQDWDSAEQLGQAIQNLLGTLITLTVVGVVMMNIFGSRSFKRFLRRNFGL